MAQKINLEDQEWKLEENHLKYCEELEKGNILFFPKIPFSFPDEDLSFLLKQKQGASKVRKNIAYKPRLDKVTNHHSLNEEDQKRLHQILKNYSKRATELIHEVLAPYAKYMRHDYASFRPFQEKGRNLRLRARNDLLHIDAFPTRPLHGGRVLRFFTNINPDESRYWITAEPFKELLQRYGGSKGLPFPRGVSYSPLSRLIKRSKKGLKKMGLKIPLRSPYDFFMLKMHHFLKENEEFQKGCSKTHWEFPPHSCWAVFTDQVSHAALAGQYALEQTFIVSQDGMLYPEEAPVHLLERVTQRNMVH